MNKIHVVFSLSILLSGIVHAQENSSIIASGAKLEMLADGFSFTEGPAVDKQGNIYFTDQPNNLILKWSAKGGLSTFSAAPGRANGLYVDKENNLLSCSDMDNQIWKFNPDGGYEVIVSDYQGKMLNGPNDLWVHPDGRIYFTDPLYKRDYWLRNPEMQQDGEHVYSFCPQSKELKRVADDLEKPNGIIGSPDGKRLYVADIKANKTYVYAIQEDGSLTNKQLFTSLGSDGMTIDEAGNIYLTGKGVTVFNPQGEQIEHIPVEANWTANVCFGGDDMKTLFITASQYLYSIRMRVKGAH